MGFTTFSYFPLIPHCSSIPLGFSYHPILSSTLSLAPLQPLKTFWSSCACVCGVWLSILESCQVYVVFVFMGVVRVNSSLDTWEIECISCEALSLFTLELINYFDMIGLLGWFSWMSWFFGSPYVRCYPFLSFLDVHWEICECFFCLPLISLDFVLCFILPRSAKG